MRTPARVGAAAGFLAVTVFGWWLAQRTVRAAGASPSLEPRAAVLAADRIAVAPLVDRTGDSTLALLGVVAADWIARDLRRSAVHVVPVTAALRAATIAAADSSDPTRRIAEETGAALVLSGTVLGRGDSLFLQATLTDARQRRIASNIEPIGVSRDEALAGVDRLRRRVAGEIARVLGIQATEPATAEGALPSYPTYREYALGLKRYVASDWLGAAYRFQRAAVMDTAFATPVLMAAMAYGNMGDLPATDSLLRRLAPQRTHLPPYEASVYDAIAATRRGDHRAAYEAYRTAAALAPGTLAQAQLAQEALALNRPREALQVLDSLDPTRGELRGFLPYWSSRTTALHLLGEHKAELDAARQAHALHPGSADVDGLEWRALAGLGQCGRVVARLEADTTHRDATALVDAAHECAAHGDETSAGALADRALQLARDAARRAPSDVTAHAVVEALSTARRYAEARSLADSLSFMSPYDADLRGRRGLIAVRLGDSATAQGIDAWLQVPDPFPDFGRRTLWRARLAAARGDVAGATALLDRAAHEGMPLDRPLHADPDLLPARSSPAFREWLKPKG